jgi:hypothetical protein
LLHSAPGTPGNLPVTASQRVLKPSPLQSTNDYEQKPEVITKVLLSAVIMFGAAAGAAIPAYADPSVFGNLSCSCEQPADGARHDPADKDQVNRGIQSGLTDGQANPARRNLPSSNSAPAVSAGNRVR